MPRGQYPRKPRNKQPITITRRDNPTDVLMNAFNDPDRAIDALDGAIEIVESEAREHEAQAVIKRRKLQEMTELRGMFHRLLDRPQAV